MASPKNLVFNAENFGTIFEQSENVCEDGFFFSPGMRSKGFVVCLVLGDVLAQAENGKINRTGTSSGGAEAR